MHLIEAYSLYCGLKIDKPIIKEEDIPNFTSEKFIIFNPHSKGESRNYKNWQAVIDKIYSEIKNQNIDIIQIDSSEKEYQGCKKITNISFNQTAWLTNRSLALLGIDSFCMHLASALNKPMLILFGGHHHFKCCGPYFGDSSKQHFFISDLKGNKPTFSQDVGQEYMDQFDPKEIATSFIEKVIKTL